MEYAELAGNDEGKNLATTLNLNLAMACIKGGNNQEGIDAATKVIATEGAATHVKAYYWRATGYFNLKDHKYCIADCVASVKLQPKNKAARKLYKKSLAAKKKAAKSAKAKVKHLFSGAFDKVASANYASSHNCECEHAHDAQSFLHVGVHVRGETRCGSRQTHRAPGGIAASIF